MPARACWFESSRGHHKTSVRSSPHGEDLCLGRIAQLVTSVRFTPGRSQVRALLRPLPAPAWLQESGRFHFRQLSPGGRLPPILTPTTAPAVKPSQLPPSLQPASSHGLCLHRSVPWHDERDAHFAATKSAGHRSAGACFASAAGSLWRKLRCPQYPAGERFEQPRREVDRELGEREIEPGEVGKGPRGRR